MVRYGNIHYILFIIICILFIILNILFLKNKSQNFSYRYILILLLINFSFHFLKQFIQPYRNQEFPQILRKSTFENICAVSTLIFPFIFILKKKILKDYMFYIGTISGAVAFLVPTEALAYNTINLDVIRFYFCHFILLCAPILMMYKKFHHLNYKRIFFVPFVFIGILIIIFLNELLLISIGWVSSTKEEFFDPNIRNSSWIFGIGDDFNAVRPFVMWMVPKFLYLNHGKEFFIPIVWMIIPLYILELVWCIILTVPFEFKHITEDIISIKRRV